jgi:Mg2+ and Co2+ transporter CorA
MPLSDIDMQRRRFSIGVPLDLVDFIVYSYNEHICEERYYRSVNELIKIFKNKTTNDKCYWIEVINRSNVNLPNKIKLLCEYFDIHPLTIEGITTLAPYMKLDLFYDHPAIYLLMKIISWNGLRVEQQQISFYLKCSKNILITFQEDSIDNQSFFDSIRNRLRHDFESSYHPHNRLKQMNIDYLFYCLVDTIIER